MLVEGRRPCARASAGAMGVRTVAAGQALHVVDKVAEAGPEGDHPRVVLVAKRRTIRGNERLRRVVLLEVSQRPELTRLPVLLRVSDDDWCALSRKQVALHRLERRELLTPVDWHRARERRRLALRPVRHRRVGGGVARRSVRHEKSCCRSSKIVRVPHFACGGLGWGT